MFKQHEADGSIPLVYDELIRSFIRNYETLENNLFLNG